MIDETPTGNFYLTRRAFTKTGIKTLDGCEIYIHKGVEHISLTKNGHTYRAIVGRDAFRTLDEAQAQVVKEAKARIVRIAKEKEWLEKIIATMEPHGGVGYGGYNLDSYG